MNRVTDKLTNVTIGEIIDCSEAVYCDNVLLLLKERKSRRQACDKETLKSECFKRFGLQEPSFTASIQKLIKMGCIKENSRAGKITLSPLTSGIAIPDLSNQHESTAIDLVELKKFLTERLGHLNEKIDKTQASLEMKDVVINLSREELRSTQESLKWYYNKT